MLPATPPEDVIMTKSCIRTGTQEETSSCYVHPKVWGTPVSPGEKTEPALWMYARGADVCYINKQYTPGARLCTLKCERGLLCLYGWIFKNKWFYTMSFFFFGDTCTHTLSFLKGERAAVVLGSLLSYRGKGIFWPTYHKKVMVNQLRFPMWTILHTAALQFFI